MFGRSVYQIGAAISKSEKVTWSRVETSEVSFHGSYAPLSRDPKGYRSSATDTIIVREQTAKGTRWARYVVRRARYVLSNHYATLADAKRADERPRGPWIG